MAVAVAAGDRGEDVGGRIFFSGASRSLVEEDQLSLTTVGVDIGSSTSHLMFSRITLERLDTRYVVADRELIHASGILLTPYISGGDIDAARLGAFVERAYAEAGLSRDEIDSGALILTGVAVRRRNARAIGELFAGEAGRFVAVSAGDNLETVMAAHGSGALAASRDGRTVVNIDAGGGTTKISVCRGGEIVAMTAVEAGARLVVTDAEGRVERLEEFGARLGREAGVDLAPGAPLGPAAMEALAAAMVARIGRVLDGAAEPGWLRLPPLPAGLRPDMVVFSGGVSEFMNGTAVAEFGDLGRAFARALEQMADTRGLARSVAGGIRATVVGASQYSVQVSGSTVFLDPEGTLPLRSIAAIRPDLDLSPDTLDPSAIAAAIGRALARADLDAAARPVALALAWRGSATYARLDALARGLALGLKAGLAAGQPLVIVSDGDVGGLLGMHLRENGLTANPIVSIDGIELSDFDFIDIGSVLRATGAVPVVVKSLLFPSECAQGEHT